MIDIAAFYMIFNKALAHPEEDSILFYAVAAIQYVLSIFATDVFNLHDAFESGGTDRVRRIRDIRDVDKQNRGEYEKAHRADAARLPSQVQD
ncbi:hypothetical protein ACOJBO_01750 [Rhizobium beringeri]